VPEHFVNDGFGWECKRCRGSEGSEAEPGAATLARFFREGEAEGGGPRLSSTSLARWKDDARRVLRCGRCGAEENVANEPGKGFTCAGVGRVISASGRAQHQRGRATGGGGSAVRA
jgi:hypothetical protein